MLPAVVGFVTPAIVKVAAALSASAQLAPTSVIVTTLPVVLPVAVQLVKPPVSAIVGVLGIEKLLGNVAVTVLPAASAPWAPAVKPSVQVSVTARVLVAPANVTPVTADGLIVTALAGLTSRLSFDVCTAKLLAAIEPAVEGLVTPEIVSVP